MEENTELQPESIQHSLKLLPKREALRRIQNAMIMLNKRCHSHLTLETTLESEINKKENCYYASVQSLIDENENLLREEMKLYASWDDKNDENFSKVDAFAKQSNIDGTSFQNQMFTLRDQLSETVLYNEEELKREIDDLRNQLHKIISNDILVEKRSLDSNSKEEITQKNDDVMKQLEYITSLTRAKEMRLLVNSRNIKNTIMAMKWQRQNDATN